jgi:hypothetical protein
LRLGAKPFIWNVFLAVRLFGGGRSQINRAGILPNVAPAKWFNRITPKLKMPLSMGIISVCDSRKPSKPSKVS